jgi:cellulose synthase/poly-beta-1,6-N-acetylglucosamine synthase-like glycosyltransferase
LPTPITTDALNGSHATERPRRAVGDDWGAPPAGTEGAPERWTAPPPPFRGSSVSLVIPAKNEARNLASVLEQLPPMVDEVILVDGRSSDVTAAMALSCRPDIRILTDPEPGKGHALRTGFAAARGELIVAMDADGSMSPQELPRLVYFLEHGYDFVKGSRFVAGGGSLDLTRIRRLGNRGLLLVANTLYGSQLTDLCYGFFGFRRRYLEHLDLHSAGFEIETELTVRAVQAGLRIAEIPSLELPRRSGRSNLHAFRDGVEVLRTLWRERERPMAVPSADGGPVASGPVSSGPVNSGPALFGQPVSGPVAAPIDEGVAG